MSPAPREAPDTAAAAARVAALETPELPITAHRGPPCALVVFGASGDLTSRKLVPALYKLRANGALDPDCMIVGVARREWSSETFRDVMRKAVSENMSDFDAECWTSFASQLHWCTGTFGDDETYRRLMDLLSDLDSDYGLESRRLFYLATPPSEFGPILRALRQVKAIATPGQPAWTRVIVEKPFGRDLASAQALNELVGEVLDESQIYRIDHYLGKETVQNILVLRFANTIFEPLWNRKYVDYIEISAAETVGVGSRGAFYEQTGVLRDIVQSHLLEVLALTAMEPPTTVNADEVRGEKLKVLRALRMPWPDTIARDVVLGQYRGYRDEPKVAADSVTPTYAALRVFVDNWRWQGVPFYLRTGKKLAKRVTEVAIHLQPIPLCLFGREELCERVAPNVLVMRIQPDEGICLQFTSKIPGHDAAVGTVAMDMSYVETFGGHPPQAYERLLLDAMRGDPTLFSRRDAVEASWRWITPILEHCEKHPAKDLPNYDPGSWGPTAADTLMRRDGRAWRTP